MRRGQSSLEFMLVLAALLCFLSVSVSAFSGLHKSSIAALDSVAAESLVRGIEGKAELLEQLGDGSGLAVSAGISGEWLIEKSGHVCIISIRLGGRAPKSFSTPEKILCGLDSGVHSGRLDMRLIKSGGRIMLLYR